MGGTVTGRKLLGVGNREVEERGGRRPETRGSFRGSSGVATHSRRYLVATIDGACTLGLVGWGKGGCIKLGT